MARLTSYKLECLKGGDHLKLLSIYRSIILKGYQRTWYDGLDSTHSV
jgi:hypothetical protein